MEHSSLNIVPLGPDDGSRRLALEYYNLTVVAIDILYEAALVGNEQAVDMLREAAETLIMGTGSLG